jgi:outer membrane protein TolC
MWWLSVGLLCAGTRLALAAPVPVTLGQALERADRDNPEIVALRAVSEAEQARADAVARATRPQLSVSVDAFRTDDPVRVFGSKLGAGTLGASDLAIDRLTDPASLSHITSSLRLEVPVDAFGAARSAARAASAGARAHQASVEEARHDLRHRVAESYRQAVLAAAAIGVTERVLEAARAREEELQARVDAGRALVSDLLRARSRRREREADLAARRADSASALDVLRRLIGAPAEEEIVVADEAIVPEALSGDLETWTGRALASRAAGRGAAERLAAARETTRAQEKAARPALALYGQVQDDRGPFSGGGGQSFTVGVAVRWTLVDPARGRRVAAARADERAAESAARAARDQVRLEVALAWRRAEAARQRWAAASGGSEEAREALRVVRERRQAGMATLTDELETESAAFAADLQELRAVTEVALADAALRRAAGEL